jgi:hypothetical protein
MRTESGGYRRDYLRALAQRVEVDAQELRIMGSKSELLRTLVAASSAKTAGFGVPSSVPKWRARRDSNSQPSESKTAVPWCCGHLSFEMRTLIKMEQRREGECDRVGVERARSDTCDVPPRDGLSV